MSKSTFITRLTLVSILLLSLTLLPTTNPAQAARTLGGGVVISEIRIDMPSTDAVSTLSYSAHRTNRLTA